jgi:hypothetical protein
MSENILTILQIKFRQNQMILGFLLALLLPGSFPAMLVLSMMWDAGEMLAYRHAVVDDEVIVAVWSCAIPSLLLSGFSTPVCDPKLLICFPLLKKPAETCVTEYVTITFVVRHCPVLTAAWSCPR